MYIRILLLILLPSIATATEYYVSPNGAETWPNCTTQGSPCEASDTHKEFLGATAGDTVYFLDGQYSVIDDDGDSTDPAFSPLNSGNALDGPITFKSLNLHGATITGYAGELSPDGQYDENFPDFLAVVVGAHDVDYIVWDGFIINARDIADSKGVYAMNRFQNSDHSAIKNCEIIGYEHAYGGHHNHGGVYFEGSTYLLVSNNKIHGFKEVNNNENNGGVFGFDSNHVTITNNEIYDCAYGIRYKDNIDDSPITNNFIHDNYVGVYISNTNTGGSCERNAVSNNLITNNSSFGLFVPSNGIEKADDLVVHDNTLWSNGSTNAIIGDFNATHYPILYNNIFGGATTGLALRNTVGNQIAECDHNQFTATISITINLYKTDSVTYTSLATWQSSGELDGGGNPGTGSLASDPLFVDASGSLNTIADFALDTGSPCIGAGRFGADMGANIALVGVLSTAPKYKFGANLINSVTNE